MNARERRPRLVPPRGMRVALITPQQPPSKLRNEQYDRALKDAVENIARIGWVLISLVDPDRPMDALRMVIDGLVDFVVVTKREHFPYVVTCGDLESLASQTSTAARTRTPPQMDSRESSPRRRRPQPVEGAAEPDSPRDVGIDQVADTLSAPAQVAQATAESGQRRPNPEAADRDEIRPGVTDPIAQMSAPPANAGGRRPRASDRRNAWLHSDVKTSRRRRRA